MRVISFILCIFGIFGIVVSIKTGGDIAVPGYIGSVTSLLSGVGFFLASKAIRRRRYY